MNSKFCKYETDLRWHYVTVLGHFSVVTEQLHRLPLRLHRDFCHHLDQAPSLYTMQEQTVNQ